MKKKKKHGGKKKKSRHDLVVPSNFQRYLCNETLILINLSAALMTHNTSDIYDLWQKSLI